MLGPKSSTLSLHDALPISAHARARDSHGPGGPRRGRGRAADRSEEHTSELQSLRQLGCRLLLEKKQRSWTKRLETANRVILALARLLPPRTSRRVGNLLLR